MNVSMVHFVDFKTFNSIKYGIFAVNKKKNVTSAETLEVIKNVICQESYLTDSARRYQLRAGHGGTLDKSATGVLVIGLCYGCKMLSKLLHGNKSYEVVGKLGTATDTYNDEGEVTLRKNYSHVTRNYLIESLNRFRGKISQVPPKYSALKRHGVRLSDLVREGKEVIVEPREVNCFSLTLTGFTPPYFRLELTSGPGFYVRSLVHDLGLAVGSCAHVVDLVRTKQGPFVLSESLNMDSITLSTIFNNFYRFKINSARRH